MAVAGFLLAVKHSIVFKSLCMEAPMYYSDFPEFVASFVKPYVAITEGVTQSAVAEAVGIHRSIMSLFLSRKLSLLPEQIEAILEYLGIENEVKSQYAQSKGWRHA
jgi:hypothetical protein